ncbi:RNA polymerase I enhancer binding protein [Xylographa bjoerkii]|nr:RNA polymerase I enhancer binding protein [Xylographa bjoerkii]
MRQKPAHRMGNTSSQATGPGIEEHQETALQGVADEVGGEVLKKRKKRRSIESIENGEGSHAAGGKVGEGGRKKRRRKAKRNSVDVEEEHERVDESGLTPHMEDSAGPDKQASVDLGEEPINHEAESALVLLSLRNGVAASTRDDDLAASQQLLAESSPVKVSKKRKKPAKGSQDLQASQLGGQKRKSKSTAVEPTAGEPSQLDDTFAMPLPPLATKVTTNGQSRYMTPPTVESQNLPQSMQSLDDIPSDDENIAPLLNSYDNGELGLNFGFSELEDNPEIESPYKKLATDGWEQATAAAALRVDDDLTRRLRAADRTTKKGRKRNKKLPDHLFGSDDDETNNVGAAARPVEPMPISGIDGQCPVALRNENHVVMLNCAIDEQIPIDPKLSAQGFSVLQVENYQHSENEATAITQQVRPGKLKRVSNMRNRAGEINPTLDNFVIRDHEISQGFSAPDHFDESMQAPNGSDIDGISAPATKRKKRRMPESQPDPSQPLFSTRAPRSSQISATYNPSLSELADNGGQFTDEEYGKMLAFRDSYCAQHGWSHRKFADQIHANARNNPGLSAFWTEIQDLLPYRKRQPLQKFCRRKFHNFEKRGAWTAEDDEMLKQAVAEKGKSWKAVGEFCDRMAEDVRDRWRNYHHNAENRNTEAWTDEEVKSLVRAVGECIWRMQEDQRQRFWLEHGFPMNTQEPSEDELEKMIVWQVVSDRMGGQRSRLQCSYKWKALKNIGRTDFARALRRAQKAMAKLQEGVIDVPVGPRKDWRVERARKKVQQNMLPGDRYDLLEALLNCGASEEAGIPWLTLGKGEEWRQKWKLVDVRAAWDVIKEEAGEDGDLGERFMDVVNSLLTDLMRDHGERLDERWEPLSEDAEAEDENERGEMGEATQRKVKTKRKPKGKGKRGKAVLSNDRIGPLDETDPELAAPVAQMQGTETEDNIFDVNAQEEPISEDEDTRLARLLQNENAGIA